MEHLHPLTMHISYAPKSLHLGTIHRKTIHRATVHLVLIFGEHINWEDHPLDNESLANK